LTPAAVLADLRRRGVELRAEGDLLRLRAPRGVLTDADLVTLRGAKAAVLAALAAEERQDRRRAPTPEVGVLRPPLVSFGTEPPSLWLSRRCLGWLAHLQAHDPEHASPAFARELALDDWRLALAREPGSVQ
jgi:hypothetical protein